MSTLTLPFDVAREPRKTAPYVSGSETSQVAAQEISKRLNALQRTVLELLLTDGPMTDNELRDYTRKTWGWADCTARVRRIELSDLGFVADTGEVRKKCRVRAITEAGREYLQRTVAP